MQLKIAQIVFSKRKTYSLQFNDNGNLIIKVPIGMNDDEVKKLILKHKKWILKKSTIINSHKQKLKNYEFKQGEKFLYLGKYYKLNFVENQIQPIILDQDLNISVKYKQSVRELLIKWYKENAKDYFSKRIEYFAERYDLKYNKIKVSSAKQKWGSCSNTGNINIAWRLIMAPIPVIDYVIIHELVHLKIKNHSKKFWDMVKTIMPGYKVQRNWLKENEPLLRLNKQIASKDNP